MPSNLLQWLNRILKSAPLTFESAVCSRQGGREHLEDAEGCAFAGAHAGCWVVADGVGGHGAGDIAAQRAVATILQHFRRQPICTVKHLEALLSAAHASVAAARQPGATANMATTAVVLVVANGRAVWGHVGDSRLYYFHDGELRHVTKDQSLTNLLLDRGALTLEQAGSFSHRNVILHALGQDMSPDIITHGPVRLHAGDGFLLCSDGVWELASADELCLLWQNSRSADEWLAALETLVACRAAEKTAAGQPADNYTAMVVRIVG